MGRWQLLQAILLFAGAPFCVLFLVGAAAAAATDRVSAFPVGAALALTLAWSGALYAPKLLAYLEVLISSKKRTRYGGAARFLAGVLMETVFTLTYDAIGPVSKSVAMVRLAFGARPAWAAQNRSDRGVGWGEVAIVLAANAAGDCGVCGICMRRMACGALGVAICRWVAGGDTVRGDHRRPAAGALVKAAWGRRGAGGVRS